MDVSVPFFLYNIASAIVTSPCAWCTWGYDIYIYIKDFWDDVPIKNETKKEEKEISGNIQFFWNARDLPFKMIILN